MCESIDSELEIHVLAFNEKRCWSSEGRKPFFHCSGERGGLNGAKVINKNPTMPLNR